MELLADLFRTEFSALKRIAKRIAALKFRGRNQKTNFRSFKNEAIKRRSTFGSHTVSLSLLNRSLFRKATRFEWNLENLEDFFRALMLN